MKRKMTAVICREGDWFVAQCLEVDVASQKGSHVQFVKSTDEGTRPAIVPHHREIAVGTLRSILRQAGLTPDELEAL